MVTDPQSDRRWSETQGAPIGAGSLTGRRRDSILEPMSAGAGSATPRVDTRSTRLGEFLVRKGLLGRGQLEEALHAQLIRGGHLGTCLMELGHLDEFQLGQVLSEMFQAPFAPPGLLRTIRPEVVRSVPVKLVERHDAVPFELHGKTLRVAMINPRHLPALDEIAFASGTRAEPWVAPEARILQAMERHYDIPRTSRFTALCRRLDGAWIDFGGTGKAAGARVGHPRRREAPDDAGKKSAAPRERRVRRAARAVTAPATDEPAGETRSWGDLSAPPINWKTINDAVARDPEDDLPDLLCSAESADGLAAAFLEYASRSFARTILFAVKCTTATVWSHRGLPTEPGGGGEVAFSITSEPIFELVLGEGHYKGPLPADPRYRTFYDTLKIPPPSEILILPVHLEDRLVALIYGDGRRSTDIEGGIEGYRRLARRLSLALHLILLKRKIHLL